MEGQPPSQELTEDELRELAKIQNGTHLHDSLEPEELFLLGFKARDIDLGQMGYGGSTKKA